ncbi:protoporphyrinogen oxidase [Dactylosporangium sp. AC04546]|uniref:protoporphyrinogen oxidase n=1 Tax=Dactylosporangium sp. AC04546 TaxID=2862460 RepID=UPI001EDDD461|nr:protoporphyrinogen oxidase [Dactylosporangium sp. AC04546]WVK85448.1 protoporphyrinogen oxidase [Dactylosporangium sp. AC04546]
MTKRVVVVGGGIAGLAAAQRLHERGLAVVLVDRGERTGGKLRTGTLAGGPVEHGAESFLMAAPEGGPSAAVRLAGAAGLAGAVVHPTPARAAVALDGGLRDLPTGTLMGIPLDSAAPDEPSAAPLLPPGGDVTVGELVRPRRGDAVVDHYVEPLLGGVYAGRADRLSLRMALPKLAAAAERSHTLTDALRSAVAAPSGGPVFGTIDGGMSRLTDAVTAALPDVRLGSTVRDLRRHGAGWRLTVGSTHDPVAVDADGVVLAVPAAPAARLLSTVDGLAGVPLEYASVALVALALPATKLPELSGFLVPVTEGFAVKAVTFFDQKWAHLHRPGVTLLRASVGRHGDEQQLQRTDDNLVALVRHELAVLLGVDALPDPVAGAVYRWGGALPQYTPHHQDRVRALREALGRHPAIAVAGAAYDGVGIPACITSGWAAADAVLEGLGE